MTTFYQMNESFLAHYGVLGMKWGRRKAKSSSGSSGIRNGKSKKSSISKSSSNVKKNKS